MSMQVVSSEQAQPAKDTSNMTDLAAGEAKETKSAKAEETAEQSEELEADEITDDSDASDDGDDESKDDSQESDEKPKRKPGFKRRIDKLNKRLSDKEREAEYWREQALKSAKPRDQETKPVTQSQASGDKEPVPDDFETHQEYVRALVKFERDQLKAQDERESREKSARDSFNQRLAATRNRVQEFSKTVDDFDEVIAEVDGIDMSVAVQEILMDSENGPQLMYELAKTPKEYRRICQLSPLAAARELGKIEARIVKDQAEPKEEQKTTKAPKPIATVGAKGGSGVKKSIFDKNLTQAEYERIRREQMKDRSAWG